MSTTSATRANENKPGWEQRYPAFAKVTDLMAPKLEFGFETSQTRGLLSIIVNTDDPEEADRILEAFLDHITNGNPPPPPEDHVIHLPRDKRGDTVAQRLKDAAEELLLDDNRAALVFLDYAVRQWEQGKIWFKRSEKGERMIRSGRQAGRGPQ